MKYITNTILLIFLSAHVAVYAATMSERTYEISSIRMSVDDLDKLLSDIRSLVAKANEGVPKERIKETISLTHNGNTLKLEDWKSLSQENSVPEYITEVWYRYESPSESPIKEVDISLSNAYRKFSVQGTDNNQVEAISTVLLNKLEAYSNFLSSNSFKLLGGILLIIVGAVLVNLRKGDKIVIPANLIGLFCLLAPTILPWSDWLPGVAIFSGTASFIDRHINQISVFGVILGLGSIFVPIINNLRKRKSNN